MTPHKNVIETDFYGNELQPEKSQCMVHTIILIYSFFLNGKNYYPITFSEEWKYELQQ